MIRSDESGAKVAPARRRRSARTVRAAFVAMGLFLAAATEAQAICGRKACVIGDSPAGESGGRWTVPEPQGPSVSDQYRRTFDRAVELYNAQRYAEALPLLEQAARMRPDSGSARRLLGKCLFWLDRYSDALRELDEAIRLDGGDGEAYKARGWVFQKSGDVDRAIAAYRRAGALGVPEMDAKIAALEEWKAANSRHEVQRRQDEQRQSTWREAKRVEDSGVGDLAARFAAAAQLWRDYLKTYPNDPFALNSLGNYLFMTLILDAKRPRATIDEAVDALTRAIRIEPANGSHHERMASLLAYVGRADEALAFADEAARKVADREFLARSFFSMTNHAMRDGNLGAVERLIEIGARVLPAEWTRNSYSRLRVAQYNRAADAREHAAAVKAARALVDLFPQRHDYHSLLAQSLVAAGSIAEGKAARDRGLQAARNDDEKRAIVSGFNMALTRAGDWPSLLDSQRAYLALVPPGDKEEVALMRALIAASLTRLGRREEARAEFEKFFAYRTNDAKVYTIVGNALLNAGARDAALRSYERALALTPGDAGLQRRIDELRGEQAQARKAPVEPATGKLPLEPFASGNSGRQPDARAQTPPGAAGAAGGSKGQAIRAAETGAQGAGIAAVDAAGAAAAAGRVFDRGDLKTPAAGPAVAVGGRTAAPQPRPVPEAVRRDRRWQALELIEEMHLASKALAERDVKRIETQLDQGAGDRSQLQVELVKARDEVSKAEAQLNTVEVQKKELISILAPDFSEEKPAGEAGPSPTPPAREEKPPR